ncbi:MAG: arabinose-5-phosphate isomerase [Deltaproteobacteria bacterium RBG_13_43_22]|jgi:arabinose-5-phosphate isomerase|nr:MAG: arabinose-5-phosphate isomerase [Deltaproteobacteria bacterium RBG_13_43_22]
MLLDDAREVLEIEAQGILNLIPKLGPGFEMAVEAIYRLKGRVILTGIGKTGIVARKIVATLNSTGTPALFLHSGEAMHGDLGMVTSRDIVLAVSNSGETAELNSILPSIKKIGAKLISFVGNPESTLAKQSDLVLDVGVEKEACPLGLAPTASTTAALAMGDALAVALIKRRQFNQQDFRRFHPGGSLGERLAVKVSAVMLTGEQIPLVSPKQTLFEAIEEMDAKDLGATLVVDHAQKLMGILTDGDLRRLFKRKTPLKQTLTGQVMTPDPKSISPEVQASEALEMMEQYLITILPIVDSQKRVVGVLHLHDLLGKGEFKFSFRE